MTNLDHKFDVTALFETWTSDNKQNSLKSGTIDGYQSYLGTTGTSIKCGCGFFVKEGLRFQHRQDLSLSFKDNEIEFRSCWIELVNDLGPNTIIGCYYRHTKKSSNNKFLEQLKTT